MKKVEKLMHTVIITVVLTSAVVPLVFQSYNPSYGNCVADVIYDICSTKDEGKICIVRGSEKVYFVIGIIMGATLTITIIFCTVVMMWVHVH
eukprot:14983914-Ditylum_brightwellii.AAC.1